MLIMNFPIVRYQSNQMLSMFVFLSFLATPLSDVPPSLHPLSPGTAQQRQHPEHVQHPSETSVEACSERAYRRVGLGLGLKPWTYSRASEQFRFGHGLQRGARSRFDLDCCFFRPSQQQRPRTE